MESVSFDDGAGARFTHLMVFLPRQSYDKNIFECPAGQTLILFSICTIAANDDK